MGLFNWGKKAPSRTVTLPPRGRALILSDLHGHLGDWEAFLARTRVLDRIEAGEDLYLLITGDAPDVLRHQKVDPAVPDDGDVRIVAQLAAAQARLGPRAARLVYLEGNHDFHVSRICREVARYHAARAGRRAPREDDPPAFTPQELASYCEHYRATYGEAVYENNVSPYDMVHRVAGEHLRFLEAGPVLAVLGASGIVVTHAGPPRMQPWRASALRREIEGANREVLSKTSPDKYYASPYHQLLNNRFRAGDYTLDDVDHFLAVFSATLLVTGHTPHPYLVDYERRAPIAGCGFRDGLGFVGERQVVLCSSFGAFDAAWKRYLEVDLARRYDGVDSLFEGDVAAKPLYPSTAPSATPAFPGAEFVFGSERQTRRFRPVERAP